MHNFSISLILNNVGRNNKEFGGPNFIFHEMCYQKPHNVHVLNRHPFKMYVAILLYPSFDGWLVLQKAVNASQVPSCLPTGWPPLPCICSMHTYSLQICLLSALPSRPSKNPGAIWCSLPAAFFSAEAVYTSYWNHTAERYLHVTVAIQARDLKRIAFNSRVPGRDVARRCDDEKEHRLWMKRAGFVSHGASGDAILYLSSKDI